MANTQQHTSRGNSRSPQPSSAQIRRAVDAEMEHQYWSRNYAKQPDYEPGRGFNEYEAAYRTGYEGYTKYPDMTFAQAETVLRRDYESLGTKAALAWAQAKSAVRAGWERVERAIPGDFDNDAR